MYWSKDLYLELLSIYNPWEKERYAEMENTSLFRCL